MSCVNIMTVLNMVINIVFHIILKVVTNNVAQENINIKD